GPYFVIVENAYGSTNSRAADLTVTSSGPGQAPYIVVQPTNQTVTAGTSAIFSVTAGGTAPLSYQWIFDETNLVGTNATLVITNTTSADAGPYFVMVENAYGSTNSATAILTVNSSGPSQAPYIIDQPTNQTVAAGGTATFSVVAGGAAPLSYQWYFGETNLVGTNATLTINDVTAADAGPYSVIVENAYGSTNSRAAILTVTSSSPSAVDHFTWNPIPSPRFRAVPFRVTVTARDVAGAIVTNFAGIVRVNLTNGMPVLPPGLGNFVHGSSTGMVVVPLPGTNLVLKATDASGHTGFSNPFNVVNLPVLTPICCNNMFQITWPQAASGFVLEMTTNLASGNWVAVPEQPLQSSNQCMQAILPASTNIPVFYRLHFMGQ
ncbi:MAG TPA: immunoglobulin domain-containing protein, partial [Alphaproteobacteria bacterium]|nr:immunoglobulin domain-containing protein [Alphaproteobacteria bacterium]